ncbi:hypothetical protein BU17DRAFT_44783 [Hysterangium stoloniferum]|nr:hypothetical protein BU17DRAFT_44783 [Hysterangium stoloniferum]
MVICGCRLVRLTFACHLKSYSKTSLYSRLIIFSIPCLAFPRFILFLSSTIGNEHRDTLTPLEKFLSLHFAILALSVAAGLLLSAPDSQAIIEHVNSRPHNPQIFPLTSGFLLTSFLAYNTPGEQIGPLSLFVALGTGTVGLWGLYVLLFAGSSSISRKTGADKRTSRFLFWNQSSASAQKKRWRKDRGA